MLALSLLAVVDAQAAIYEIGPGKTYTTIGAAPWSSLQPGDNVKIYYATYHEKLDLTIRGTEANPIIIEGVPDGSGNLPIIDGTDATQGGNFDCYGAWQYHAGLGLVYIGLKSDYATYGVAGYFTLKNLRIQGAKNGVTWTDKDGGTHSMTNPSAIYLQSADHVTLEGLEVVDNAQGIFAKTSSSNPPYWIDGLTVRKSKVWDNGVVGNYLYHNVYVEAESVTYEYNYFGAPKAGMSGNNVKDRSAGFVFRYNWLVNGGHLLDLVDCQDGCGLIKNETTYRESWVYGNVFINAQADPDAIGRGGAATLFHVSDGSASGSRDGTLYFYNNTVVNLFNRTYGTGPQWRLVFFQISSSGVTAEIHDNIFLSAAYTTGQTRSETYWKGDQSVSGVGHGTLTFGANLASTMTGTVYPASPTTGTVTGLENIITPTGNDAGFTDIAAFDLSLTASSQAVDTGTALPARVSSGNYLAQDFSPTAQYLSPHTSTSRTQTGATMDLGAFEYDGTIPPTITTTLLADGVRNAAYTTTCLAVTGGTAPYTWAVSAGSLCSGLSLNSSTGCISGTPSAATTCSFTARVTDNGANQDTQALSITVNEPPPALTVVPLAGSDTVAVQFGIAGLASNQSCYATLMNSSGTVLSQQTSTGGPAKRIVTFTGLNAGGSYKVEATCGSYYGSPVSFSTRATSGDGSFSFKLKPSASILAQMTALDGTLATAKAAIYWQAPGAGSYTATKTVCSSSCTITELDLASGVHQYYVGWEAGATYATGAINWTNGSYPSDGERVTVGSITYTFRDTVAQPFDVKIVPDSTEASYNNLWEAIDYQNWTPGVSPNAPGANYYATAKNPDVVRLTWSAPGNTATLRAAVLGSGGNSLPLSETSASMTVTPLAGGTDALITSTSHTPGYIPIP